MLALKATAAAAAAAACCETMDGKLKLLHETATPPFQGFVNFKQKSGRLFELEMKKTR